jgi:hypothetical protein
MTAKNGGLVEKLAVASQALYETKVLPQPIPLGALQDAVDPSYLKAYMTAHKR